MKVYELMKMLGNAPAGAEVLLMKRRGKNQDPVDFSVNDVFVEDPNEALPTRIVLGGIVK